MIFPLHTQATEVDELKQLVISLNSHIVNLEKRVKHLENLVKVKNINISTSKVTWRKLQRGMSFSQVRNLLGEPKDIDAGYLTYWYYSNKTSTEKVIFSNGKVNSWKEPKN